MFTAIKREEFAKSSEAPQSEGCYFHRQKFKVFPTRCWFIYVTFQKVTKTSFKCLKTETGFIVDVIFQHDFLLAQSVVNEKKLKFLRKVKRYLRQRTDLYIFATFFTH